ncbi:MAG TPA: hypothetical protein VGV86_04955 [Acidimicrobiales bacterium]|nr:hypothetical protein [Acidimicrobiales bacterium]
MVRILGAATLLVTLITMPTHVGAQTRMNGVDGGVTTEDREAGAMATFEGRTIDLAGDWGAATACLVWREGGVVECFRTNEELEARRAELSPGRPAAGPDASGAAVATYAYSCSDPLRLYDYTWYGGRQLMFFDRGYWQNLANYGFEDRTSSYIVGPCPAHLAEHGDGGGWWYPGDTSPGAGEPAMQWGWQNVVSSIYIG